MWIYLINIPWSVGHLTLIVCLDTVGITVMLSTEDSKYCIIHVPRMKAATYRIVLYAHPDV